MNYVVVTTTVEDRQAAESIAERAIDQRLAACVQIVGPIRSLYRWQGKIERSTEFRCELKTATRLFQRLRTMILECHPYELPEVICTPVAEISPEYSAWLDEQLVRE